MRPIVKSALFKDQNIKVCESGLKNIKRKGRTGSLEPLKLSVKLNVHFFSQGKVFMTLSLKSIYMALEGLKNHCVNQCCGFYSYVSR